MRTAIRGGAVLVAAVAVALAWLVLRPSSRTAAPSAPSVSTTTAPVTRGDVVRRVTVAGTLGYDGSYQVVSHLPAGVVTALPEPGTVVTRGGRVFAVAGTPAVLFYGAVPAYRDFAAGMSDGADVRQLEANLVALGADPRRAMRVDDHFTSATGAAIRRWQAANGVPAGSRTSTVPIGRVVFLPGPVRLGAGEVSLGGSVAPGEPVLRATSTTAVVTARVGTDQQHLVRVGDAVRVALPAGEPVAGKVRRIRPTPVPEGEAPPAAGAGPTVEVTVTLTLPAEVGDLDQAPAQVQITVDEHHDVLMVPVSALLSAPGGYQVRVVAGDAPRLLDVEPGLYDDDAGTVEITGAGLTEGMTVEVPAS